MGQRRHHIAIASFVKTALEPPRSLQICASTVRGRATARYHTNLSIRGINLSERHGPSKLLLRLRLRCSLGYSTCANQSSPLFVNPSHARWIYNSCPRQKAVEQKQPPPAENNAGGISVINHQPPLPVRIALVSTTTALATPAFPALGFLYVVLRYTVPDASLRKTMEGRWGALFSFSTWTLLPFMYDGAVASLLLPCAVGNAIVAGGVYGLVDLACGGPNSSSDAVNKALQTPFITGSGIGATVGYVAPHYVYGPVMEQCYAMEGVSQSITTLMSIPGVTGASIATGAIAGMLLHPLLYYPTNGIVGMHWGYFSGTALAALISALGYVYYGREETGLPVPYGSFIEPSKMEMVDSIMRYNNVTREVETYSLKIQNFIGSRDKCLEGRSIADASRSYAKSNKVVFDDRLLAFVYNFWDPATATRYPEHILTIKTKKELQQRQDSMALTDASVAVILYDEKLGNGQHGRSESVPSNSSEDMLKIVADVNELSSLNKGQKQLSSELKILDEVSVAIQMLMILKQSEEDHAFIDTVPTLERFVRKSCPKLTLYTSEEQYGGESVESQLRNANWKGPKLSQAVRKWEQVHLVVKKRTWRNRALVVGAGVVLSVIGSMLRGNK